MRRWPSELTRILDPSAFRRSLAADRRTRGWSVPRRRYVTLRGRWIALEVTPRGRRRNPPRRRHAQPTRTARRPRSTHLLNGDSRSDTRGAIARTRRRRTGRSPHARFSPAVPPASRSTSMPSTAGARRGRRSPNSRSRAGRRYPLAGAPTLLSDGCGAGEVCAPEPPSVSSGIASRAPATL